MERPSFPSTQKATWCSAPPFRLVIVPPAFPVGFHPAEPPLVPRVALSRIPFSPRTIPRYPGRTRRRSHHEDDDDDPRESLIDDEYIPATSLTNEHNRTSPRYRTSSLLPKSIGRYATRYTRVYPDEIHGGSSYTLKYGAARTT